MVCSKRVSLFFWALSTARFGYSLSQAARRWHGTDDHCGFPGSDARFVCCPEEKKSTVQHRKHRKPTANLMIHVLNF